MNALAREWRIGESLFQFEPPDLLRASYHGRLCEQQAVHFLRLYEEVFTATGPFFLLGDMRTATGLEPDAQRYLNDHIQYAWLRGVVYSNARLALRALSAGFLLASEMTRAQTSSLTGKIHFATSEQEARGIIARLRAGEGGRSTG